MIPRPKIVLMPIDVPPNMATVPNSLPAVLRALLFLPVPQLRLVDDRQGNVKADPVDGQEHGREQDLPPQFGHLEDGQQLVHGRSLSACQIRPVGSVACASGDPLGTNRTTEASPIAGPRHSSPGARGAERIRPHACAAAARRGDRQRRRSCRRRRRSWRRPTR